MRLNKHPKRTLKVGCQVTSDYFSSEAGVVRTLVTFEWFMPVQGD